MNRRVHSLLHSLPASKLAADLGIDMVNTDGYIEGICSLSNNTEIRTLRWAKEKTVDAKGISGVLLVGEGTHVRNQSDEVLVWVVEKPKNMFCKAIEILFKDIREEQIRDSWKLSIEKMRLSGKISVGENTVIHPGVYIEEGVVIGDNCTIGGQGFGIDTSGIVNHRYRHIGGVYISAGCIISSNTCIDSGLVDFTYLGRGVSVDNNVQIGHNVVIGENTIVTAGAVLCGSCCLGARSWIGPNSVVLQGIEIGTEARVGAGCVVRKNLSRKALAYGNPMSIRNAKVRKLS